MKTYAIANLKGGVAKTTTVWTMGVGLHKRGYKVLLIDLDPQTNLSFTAKVDLLSLETSLNDVFSNKANIEDCVINIEPGFDIIVGSMNLANADRVYTQLGREKMLQKAIKPIVDNYDYCIIDTPPTLGVLNENALTVADSLIIPMQPDVYALQGINLMYGFIQDIQDNSNPNLNIEGILITRVKDNTKLYEQMRKQFEKVAAQMGTKVFQSAIRDTISVPRVAIAKGNLFDDDPKATATNDYLAFIEELCS